MDPQFEQDWNRLGGLAFRRREKVGELFRQISMLISSHNDHPDQPWLMLIRSWLLVPFTLWPVDFDGIGQYVCKRIEQGGRLEYDIVFMLECLESIPNRKAQDAISEYELLVEKGTYEPLIQSHAKYASQEKELLRNQKLRAEWRNFKRTFGVEKYRDRRGIVRRRMAQERNFRRDWQFSGDTEKDRFRGAFDAFCHRWNLYGMEGDKPLLLKLSVNPTAHGLMIFIPSYWSLDSKRDLNWRKINRLHKARGALRQGPKMSEGRLERHIQAEAAYKAAQQARKLTLRGEERREYIAKMVGLPTNTEARTIRRLVREGASF
jgi:hypothetical protein